MPSGVSQNPPPQFLPPSHKPSESTEPAFPFDFIRRPVLRSLLVLGFEFDILCSACHIKLVNRSAQSSRLLQRRLSMVTSELTSSVIPHFAIRRDLVLIRRLSGQVAARVAETALRAALDRPLFFF